ncbi:MAG TPA: hypothetical protein VGP25_22195, partial [Gemmatimonadaceae bacterium]|nr:hypothetical protein [Gemmatimonadaceae bacterium]
SRAARSDPGDVAAAIDNYGAVAPMAGACVHDCGSRDALYGSRLQRRLDRESCTSSSATAV